MNIRHKSLYLLGSIFLCYCVHAQLAIHIAAGAAYSAPRGAKSMGGLNPLVTYYDRTGLSYRGENALAGVGVDLSILRKGDAALRTDNFNANFFIQPAIKDIVFLKFGLGLDYMSSTSHSDAYYLKDSYYHRYYKITSYFLTELSVPVWKKKSQELAIGGGVHVSLSPYYQVDIHPGYGNIYLRNTYYYGFLSYRYKFRPQFKSPEKTGMTHFDN